MLGWLHGCSGADDYKVGKLSDIAWNRNKNAVLSPAQDDRAMRREIHFMPEIPKFSLPWQQGLAWDRFYCRHWIGRLRKPQVCCISIWPDLVGTVAVGIVAVGTAAVGTVTCTRENVAIHSVYQILVPVSTKSLLLFALSLFRLLLYYSSQFILLLVYLCLCLFLLCFSALSFSLNSALFCVRLSHLIIKFDLIWLRDGYETALLLWFSWHQRCVPGLW